MPAICWKLHAIQICQLPFVQILRVRQPSKADSLPILCGILWPLILEMLAKEGHNMIRCDVFVGVVVRMLVY